LPSCLFAIFFEHILEVRNFLIDHPAQ